MLRKLSILGDLSSYCKSILRDCEFEGLHLLGSPIEKDKPVVAYIESERYIDQFLEAKLAGVICTEEIGAKLMESYEGGIAVSESPRTSFFQLHNYLAKQNEKHVPTRIASSAVIHPTAIIEEENVVIGERCIIKANAVIKSGTVMGDDCVVSEGSVVGSPAFYVAGIENDSRVIISTGGVKLGNNVEIAKNTLIDKGALGGWTIIGDNTKIDDICHIGHDDVIGRNVIMAAGTILGGSCTIGDYCYLGMSVKVAPFIVCGRGVKMSVGAVVTKDVPDNMQMSGNFAIPHDKMIAHIKELTK